MSQDPPADDRAKPVLSIDEIRERAYDLWDQNHRPNGYELEFWLMAERELKAERGAKVEPSVAITVCDHLRGADDLKPTPL